MSETRTKLHELLTARIIKTIEIAEALCGSDPCSLTVEARGLLRRAYACVSDRAAALRVAAGDVPRRVAKPTPSEILRGIQAARARQPRRQPLLRFLGMKGEGR